MPTDRRGYLVQNFNQQSFPSIPNHFRQVCLQWIYRVSTITYIRYTYIHLVHNVPIHKLSDFSIFKLATNGLIFHLHHQDNYLSHESMLSVATVTSTDTALTNILFNFFSNMSTGQRPNRQRRGVYHRSNFQPTKVIKIVLL